MSILRVLKRVVSFDDLILASTLSLAWFRSLGWVVSLAVAGIVLLFGQSVLAIVLFVALWRSLIWIVKLSRARARSLILEFRFNCGLMCVVSV